jgi:hypothetical protein
VLYDPDLAGEDASGEWVEIYNTGDQGISLAGWSLRDNARASTLPEIIVGGHDFAVVAASDGLFEAYPEFAGIAAWLGGRIGNGLGNDGDRLELVAPDGAVVDAVSWGGDDSVLAPPVDGVPAGHSIERRVAGADTDTVEDFVDNLTPSPGRPFEAGAANPKRQRSGSTVEILESSGRESLDWLPWALMAFSGAALAGAVAWRGVDALRQRQRAT